MTFALFGSVPRWGRKGMVSLALAPTVARGTVKLVFEVAGQRYVVAREVRRTGSQVSQRAASLERLADPEGLARPGDETIPLAKDLTAVTETVERMLGLSYDDFCQCVVLPQGQFASFLHATPGDRQGILLRLLGADHYKQMMVRANQRASVSAQRAETIAETLRGYADATPEAEEQARAAQTALAQLSARVAAALPEIRAEQEALLSAEDRLRQLYSERTLLTAIRTPDDAEALEAGLAAGRAAAAKLREAERLAEEADKRARDALAQGPQRAPLELARERRGEHRVLLTRLPGLQADVSRLSEQAGGCSAEVDAAADGLEKTRTRKDETDRGAEAARQRVERLSAEHALLTAIGVPAGVTTLDERRLAAARAAAAAEQALREAEQADSGARAARDRAVPEGVLAQTARDLGAVADLMAAMDGIQLAVTSARSARTAAETGLTTARDAYGARQRDLDEARRAHVVAGLRPHLVAGQPCPLCEQTVVSLPAAARSPEVAGAQTRLDDAARALTAAEEQAVAARDAAARAEADLESTAARGADLVRSLADALGGPLAGVPLPAVTAIAALESITGHGPGSAPGTVAGADLTARALAELRALWRVRKELDRAASEAAAAADAARKEQRSAQQRAAQAEDDMAGARGALRAARDPLVELGAPQVDDSVLAAGWATLARWAGEQAGMRAAALAQARETARQADSAHQAAMAGLRAAELELGILRERAKDAALAEQEARTRLSELTERVLELGRLLADAPDEERVTAQLALCAELEAAAADADRALRAARAQRTEGETALARLERAESEAAAVLSAARDRVVALGAPGP